MCLSVYIFTLLIVQIKLVIHILAGLIDLY